MPVDAADVAVTVDVDAASDLRDAALHQKSDELATNFEVDILQKIGAANLQKMMAGVTDVSMRTQLTETLNSMEFVNNLGFTAEQTASLAAHDAVVLQNRHESLRPMLQDIFRKYDVDGNMKISKEEYKTQGRIEQRAKKLNISKEESMSMSIAKIPKNKIGDPADVGNLVAFLCSEKADYLTGCSHTVDGGMSVSI